MLIDVNEEKLKEIETEKDNTEHLRIAVEIYFNESVKMNTPQQIFAARNMIIPYLNGKNDYSSEEISIMRSYLGVLCVSSAQSFVNRPSFNITALQNPDIAEILATRKDEPKSTRQELDQQLIDREAWCDQFTHRPGEDKQIYNIGTLLWSSN